MIPELGHFALILALCMAVTLALIPLVGSFTGLRSWMAMARPLALGQFTFLCISFAVLTRAFLVNDFSVLYVAQHGNTLLPTMYKISAVWGERQIKREDLILGQAALKLDGAHRLPDLDIK